MKKYSAYQFTIFMYSCIHSARKKNLLNNETFIHRKLKEYCSLTRTWLVTEIIIIVQVFHYTTAVSEEEENPTCNLLYHKKNAHTHTETETKVGRRYKKKKYVSSAYLL